MILGVTLARSGSKGLPHKNRVECYGRPLIDWTLDALRGSTRLDQWVLVTDDPVLLKRGTSDSIPVLEEPPELATDDATSTDALRWVAGHYPDADIIVECMATNPLKTAADIDGCVALLLETGAEAVIAVTPLDGHHPLRAQKIVHGRLWPYFDIPEPSTRRQDLPPAWIRASAIYALTRDCLMTKGRFGPHIDQRPYLLPPERGVGIDTGADLAAATWYLREREKSTP